MARVLTVCMIWLFCLSSVLPTIAQTRDRRVNELLMEMSQLKRSAAEQEQKNAEHERRIAEQEKRIAELERAVKALQASALPGPIPPVTPPWHTASNWNLIKQGMSRSQVVEILGPPTRETAVMDTQTLYYGGDTRSSTTLNGSVTFVGDRLTAMTPPAFQP